MIVEGKEVNQALKDMKGFASGIMGCSDKIYTFKHLANSLLKNWLWRKDEIKLLKQTIINNRKVNNAEPKLNNS